MSSKKVSEKTTGHHRPGLVNMSIYVATATRDRLKDLADAEDRSMTAYLRRLIERHLSGLDKKRSSRAT